MSKPRLWFHRYGGRTNKEFDTVTEAIAAALEWKHAERKWGIAFQVEQDGSNLFPEMEEPEEWAAAWDRYAERGRRYEQELNNRDAELHEPDA